jgi:hypothetical protein
MDVLRLADQAGLPLGWGTVEDEVERVSEFD